MPPPTEQNAASFDYLSTLIGTSSVLLGIVALLIVLVTLPILAYLRHRALEVAREAADEAVAKSLEYAEKKVIDRMEAMLPSLVADYMELAKHSVTGEQADDIAASLEAEPNEPHERDKKSPGPRPGRPQGAGG